MSCLRSSLKAMCGLLVSESAKQSPRIEQPDLCNGCRQLGLEKAFLDYKLSKEDIIELGAFAFNAVGKSERCQVAAGTIQDLRSNPLCPFCQMILAAVREQYSTQGKTLDLSGLYQVRWRYVSQNFIRHEVDNGRYTAYMEVLSSGNSDLEDGRFNFKHEIKRKSARSIIAPVSTPGSQTLLWAREVLEKVDSLQVKKWMQICDSSHKDSCIDISLAQAAQLPSASFRLIDVEEMCIVTPVMPCRYLALSYVWGRNGENSFLALKNNISSLKNSRGLDHVLHLLPSTISDAITVTRDLGERYLWVDSLCIVQDDVESKEENIASMPLVYKGSSLTLVAGTGDSAIAGLVGVRAGSRARSQRVLTLGECKKLSLVDDIELLVVKSPWHTRGWTFQEWFLSPRCLIFLGGQVVFSCRKGTWREDLVAERKSQDIKHPLNDVDFSYVGVGYELHPHRREFQRTDVQKNFGFLLMMTLWEYFERNLTYDADILNAFAGVLKEFADAAKSTVVMGSITRFFDYFLLFQLDYDKQRRREGFPSWTWCGWDDRPQWTHQDDLPEWSASGTWILWHHRGIEPESIVQIPRPISIDWSNANPDRDSSSDEEEDDFSAWVQWLLFKHRRTAEATPFRLTEGPLFNADISKQSGYLQFWTMIAAFEFKIPSDGKKMDLYDVDGDVCGSVYLDTPSENLNTGRLLEIILLSRYNVAREVGMPYLRKKIETMRGLTRNNNQASTVESPRKRRNFGDGKLNVMLIGWSEGIAERFGIGKIWTESVNFLKDPGLTWKEIVLG